MNPPQSFGRGKCCFSYRRTRKPARARRIAAALPAGPPPTPQGVLMRYPGGDDHVLSGLMRGANEIRNRAAIVDQPSGKGRVILFAGNPCYRWQNFGEFNMLFNTVLNFNDIKTEAPKPAATDNPGR